MFTRFTWVVLLFFVLFCPGCLSNFTKRGEVIPGPWGDAGPMEGDVVQNSDRKDCFFLAPLSIIARVDRQALINLGSAPRESDNTWPIKLYLDDDKRTLHTFFIKDKDVEDYAKLKYSSTPWVAYFEKAMSEWYKLQNKGDQMTTGGLVPTVFKAIYGPNTLTARPWSSEITDNWAQAMEVMKGCEKMPMVFSTKNELKGTIEQKHGFGVHAINATHLILRNPWGFVLKKSEKQADMPKGVTITDGHGTFSITLEEAQKAFSQLYWVRPSGTSGIKVVSEIYDAVASAKSEAAKVEATTNYDTKNDPFTFGSTKKRGLGTATVEVSSVLPSTAVSFHMARDLYVTAAPA